MFLAHNIAYLQGGCMKAKQGSEVVVHYTGSLDDGTVFDTSEKREPLSFTIGSHQVLKDFEDAIVDMEKGQHKEITLTPEQAYGNPSDELIKTIPRTNLPLDREPKVGMLLALGTEDGQEFPATITKVDKDTITIDLNHPLAGKTLHFKLTLVSVS
jgi:peptidylprolyl isomerase